MKNKLVAILLALFVGGFGIHKFYLGNNFAGILYLLFCWTGIPLIISIFDLIGLVLISDQAFDARYNHQLPERLDVAILKACSQNLEGATISECVIATGADPKKVKENIDQLCRQGLLVAANRSRDHAVVYRAT
ncbi:MAG: TM2 domain-containing protein [Cyanobacteriota bacterium]|jgi:TM2 domain-containing membrane protein YozV